MGASARFAHAFVRPRGVRQGVSRPRRRHDLDGRPGRSRRGRPAGCSSSPRARSWTGCPCVATAPTSSTTTRSAETGFRGGSPAAPGPVQGRSGAPSRRRTVGAARPLRLRRDGDERGTATLFQPWATDLLPAEFDFDVELPRWDSRAPGPPMAAWVGTIGGGRFGNVEQVHGLPRRLRRRGGRVRAPRRGRVRGEQAVDPRERHGAGDRRGLAARARIRAVPDLQEHQLRGARG